MTFSTTCEIKEPTFPVPNLTPRATPIRATIPTIILTRSFLATADPIGTSGPECSSTRPVRGDRVEWFGGECCGYCDLGVCCCCNWDLGGGCFRGGCGGWKPAPARLLVQVQVCPAVQPRISVTLAVAELTTAVHITVLVPRLRCPRSRTVVPSGTTLSIRAFRESKQFSTPPSRLARRANRIIRATLRIRPRFRDTLHIRSTVTHSKPELAPRFLRAITVDSTLLVRAGTEAVGGTTLCAWATGESV